MFPTKRSPGDGMSRVAYTTPKESYSKKNSVYIVKRSNSRPTKKKNQKCNKEQAFKTCDDYVSNLLDSTTNPDLPTLGKRFQSFVKSMKKDNVGISPLKENGKGEAMHDSRKKADLFLE